jgi:hypothetical protein
MVARECAVEGPFGGILADDMVRSFIANLVLLSEF